MEARRLEHFRQRLLQEKERIDAMRRHLRERGLGATQGGSLSELSTYDNHPADIGTEMFDRSKDMALRGSLEARSRAVDGALQRIEAGSYGICLRCNENIPEERLEARPEAAYCLTCQARLDREEEIRERARPAEEELLSPPFGRDFLDSDIRGAGGQVMFDGEDAWQAVARYGTSETPQDVPEAAGYERLYVDAYERQGGVDELEMILDGDGEPLDELTQAAPGRGRTGRERIPPELAEIDEDGADWDRVRREGSN